jgi:pyrroline-5-carboxylate reductase
MNSKDKISIIGFGSMGKMLAEGLLRVDSISESQLKIYSRTLKRIKSFQNEYHDITICESLTSCTKDSKIIILCVPPNESINVLNNIRSIIRREQILISIVGSLTLGVIQRIVPCKIIRMVPSITTEVDEGTFIISSNTNCTKRDINKVYNCFRYLGEVLEVPESKIEAFTDLTSCSPGILSAIFQEYINSAIRIGKVSRKQANKVFIQTLYGLSKLYYEENNSFDAVISRVARKGGTTEIGIKVVQDNIPGCFDEVFKQTLEHQKKRKQQLKRSLT